MFIFIVNYLQKDFSIAYELIYSELCIIEQSLVLYSFIEKKKKHVSKNRSIYRLFPINIAEQVNVLMEHVFYRSY